MRRIKDYNEDYMVDRVGNMTPMGIAARIIGAVVVLSLVIWGLGFVFGWFSTGAKIISPQNVKAQWQFAYDYDSSLDQIAVQWCSYDRAVKAATDPTEKTARIDQELAVEQNYARVSAEYNGRLRDAFRAKLVRPRDVPAQAPTLQENVAQNC